MKCLNHYGSKDVQAMYLAVWGCQNGHVDHGAVCGPCSDALRKDVDHWQCSTCLHEGISGSLVADVIFHELYKCQECGRRHLKRKEADECQIQDLLDKLGRGVPLFPRIQ